MDKGIEQIYTDADIRRRITVLIGNPFVAEGGIKEYNEICAMVASFFVSRLHVDVTFVEIQNGSECKKIKYPKNANLEWLREQIKYQHDEIVYNHRAHAKGVIVMTNKRSKELAKAITYALSLDPVINKQDDNVVLTADTLTYAFNLNNISFKERKNVDAMFGVKRLEALAKKLNL